MSNATIKNRIVEWEGAKHRVLHVNNEANLAWCINVDQPAWPEPLALSAIEHLPAIKGDMTIRATIEQHEKAVMDKAWGCLKQLLDRFSPEELFDPKARCAAIEKYAKSFGCSKSSLYKYLHRYWVRGQVPAALLPDFRQCGTAKTPVELAPGDVNVTGLRGRKLDGGIAPYQLKLQDIENMREAIDLMHRDKRQTLTWAWDQMVMKHYSMTDGNGEVFALPPSERPSLRQLRYFYNSHYDIEIRLRKKYGDKNYNLKLREVIGSVGQNTVGAGDVGEIDATILPVTAVAKADRSFIIGKPTLYLIICRRTKLIPGYYLGMEHASWNAAMSAIYSIVEDKRALCKRYGVEYRPEDWPAHGILPSRFVTDRGGEWIGKMSDGFVAATGCTVQNLPAGRADWKPYVENCHRLIQDSLRSFEPSFDPDSNANARQNIDYAKNACANLDELNGFVLSAIIAYNKKILKGHRLTPEQLTAGFRATPIALWHDSVANRTGQLQQRSEEEVRFQLLPRESASVTEHGIVFKRMTYASERTRNEGWFVKGRQKAYRVSVSYDPRLVDTIYVHTGKGEPHEVTLTQRSADHAGRSFDEVYRLEARRHELNRDAEVDNALARQALLRRNEPIVKKAFEEMKAATGGKPRSSRRKDVRDDREVERAQERQVRSLAPSRSAGRIASATSLSIKPAHVPSPPETQAPKVGLSMSDRIAAAVARKQTQQAQQAK